MFTTYPTYFRYRGLRRVDPMLQGEDVFALQTAFNGLAIPCGPSDGILGDKTGRAIRDAQERLNLFVDGIAGGLTQRALVFWLSHGIGEKHGVPEEALEGQLETESGYRLGNYSPKRPDENYDAGVAQRNTKFTNPMEGFNVPLSIAVLARTVRDYFNLFEGVKDPRRRWGLAQGAWNAPAFACFLAKKEGAAKVTTSQTAQPTPMQLATFEEYIKHATMYLIF
jgi:Putative peptidoglycan binding domain